MNKAIRTSPTQLFAQFPINRKTPFAQILRATWTTSVGLTISIILILGIGVYSNDKETNFNEIVKRTPVLISVAGIVLGGSLAGLLGVILYQRLWTLLASPSGPGLTLREIQSHHLSSRLVVGMFLEPTISLGWIIGVLGLLATSAINPILQYSITIAQRPTIYPFQTTIFHAQLDHRMATKSGAANSPEDATTNTLRAATVALFSEFSGYQYVPENFTGRANFGPLTFADIECNIETVRGKVPFGSRDQYYYNFTYKFQHDDYNPSEVTIRRVDIQAVLNNDTHYLKHACSLRPARGWCETKLISGSGLMNALRCHREAWIEDVPKDNQGIGAGFIGVASAFTRVFDGASWQSQQGRPQSNSTFVSATARFQNRSVLILPSDLLSHMQRTLWHIPIAAKQIAVPADQIGGRDHLSGSVVMNMWDERLTVFTTIDIRIVALVCAIAAVVGVACHLYLLLQKNEVLGRLMRDSLVHSLTVGGMRGAPVEGACSADFDDIMKKAGGERYVFGVLRPAEQMVAGHMGLLGPVDENGVSISGQILGLPEIWRWYGGGPRESADGISQRTGEKKGQ